MASEDFAAVPEVRPPADASAAPDAAAAAGPASVAPAPADPELKLKLKLDDDCDGNTHQDPLATKDIIDDRGGAGVGNL